MRRRPHARVSHKWWHVAATAALMLAASGSPALAQNVSNEAWLGQVGGLNVLDILQEGRGNSAGADNVSLLLGQSGVGNSLTLDQYGYNNKLGTLFATQPGYARGVWQRGDLNVIEIVQRNTTEPGNNILGSVQQWSAYNLAPSSEAFNALRVIQTAADDATGVGAHYIGRIVQQNTGDADAARNSVFVVQRGGGLGIGNVLANLRQIGSGNVFGTIQSGASNRIGEIPPAGMLPIGGIIQEGTDNRGWLVQTGTANLIEYVQQYGDENAARARLSGDRNVISEIYQNNEAWGLAAIGNRLTVTISGDDNGGSGAGWVGELIQLPGLALPGIAQGVLSQMGDDNDISLAILSGIENKFGVTQLGDGNDAHLSISGTDVGDDALRNETAVFQKGDTNYVSHTVTGSDNAAAVGQEGDRNRIVLTQQGSFNVARLAIEGDDNNASASSLFGPALTLANDADIALAPGIVAQIGDGLSSSELNSIIVLVSGSANAFALYQNGHSNRIESSIGGFANALVVMQRNALNVALTSQPGSGNSLAVDQF